jgi:hypothetical protein
MSHLLSSFLGRRTLFGFAALVGVLTVASPRSFAQGRRRSFFHVI